VIAHQVAPDDVRVHAERRLDPTDLAAVPRRSEHQLGRDETAREDLLLVVDVMEEQVERANALLEPALDPFPLLGEDDPRDQIEGHDLFEAARILVHRERDPARLEAEIGRPLPPADLLRRECLQTPCQRRVVRPHHSGRGEHLVPERGRVV
jgi:hypothetical protein